MTLQSKNEYLLILDIIFECLLPMIQWVWLKRDWLLPQEWVEGEVLVSKHTECNLPINKKLSIGASPYMKWLWLYALKKASISNLKFDKCKLITSLFIYLFIAINPLFLKLDWTGWFNWEPVMALVW